MTESSPGDDALRADLDEDLDPLDIQDDPVALATYHDTLRRLRLRSKAKAIRNYVALSQKQVARVMGTTQSAVSDLESGRVDAQLSTW